MKSKKLSDKKMKILKSNRKIKIKDNSANYRAKQLQLNPDEFK